LRAAIAVVAALAAGAVPLADLPPPVAAGLVVVVVLFALQAWRRSAPAARRLALGADGVWTLVRADGTDVRATLVDAVELGPLLAMTLRTERGATCRFALLPDSARADDLRRLRVWLRRCGAGRAGLS
jgi:hypothetical protein